MRSSSKNTTVSQEEFVQHLKESGLFAGEELQKALVGMEGADGEDGAALGRRLIAAGKLTAFQVEAILERRFEDLLLGNYDILDRLGAGGMGTVFKARHRRMKRVVAIKVLSKNTASDATFVKRFQREVETVAQLSHPNIVMAFDADEAPAGPFLVMEFVNGRDLASRVQEQGALPLREALECVLQSARGLAYAHAQGIVHRDIKPANLLQDVSGVVKVADLGLARFNNAVGQAVEQPSALTQAGSVVGTVDFMAPEQAEDSTSIDQRVDIYSLGCTLHYLLTGTPPYVGQSLMSTLLKHRQAAIPSLCAGRGDVPSALDVLFRRMLSKQPSDRPTSLDEVVTALEGILAALPGTPQPTTGVRRATPTMSGGQTVALASLDQLTDHEGQQTAPTPPPPPLPAAGMTILLVEPSRTQAAIVRKFLLELGATNVQTSNAGEKALEALRACRPNLVISAMHLNDMTGIQLAQQVHAVSLFPALSFIVISSESDSTEETLLQDVPNIALLRKPFDRERLSRALLRATGRPAPESSVCEGRKDLDTSGR